MKFLSPAQKVQQNFQVDLMVFHDKEGNIVHRMPDSFFGENDGSLQTPLINITHMVAKVAIRSIAIGTSG
jgi:hypothetical protein